MDDVNGAITDIYGAAENSPAALKILLDRVNRDISAKIDSGDIDNNENEIVNLGEMREETTAKIMLGKYYDLLDEWNDSNWSDIRDREEDAIKDEISRILTKGLQPDVDLIVEKYGDEDGIDDDWIHEHIKSNFDYSEITGFTSIDYDWRGSVTLSAGISNSGDRDECIELMRVLRITPARLLATDTFTEPDDDTAPAVAAFKSAYEPASRLFSYEDRPVIDPKKFADYLIRAYRENQNDFSVDDFYVRISVGEDYIKTVATDISSERGEHLDPASYLVCSSGYIETEYEEFDIQSPIIVPLEWFSVKETNRKSDEDAVSLAGDRADYVALLDLANIATNPEDKRATAARAEFSERANKASAYVGHCLRARGDALRHEARGVSALLKKTVFMPIPSANDALAIVLEEMNPETPVGVGKPAIHKIAFYAKIAGVLGHENKLSISFGEALRLGRFKACEALMEAGFDPWRSPAITLPSLFSWGGDRTKFLLKILEHPDANPNARIALKDVPKKTRDGLSSIFDNRLPPYSHPSKGYSMLDIAAINLSHEGVDRARLLLAAGADPTYAPPGQASPLDNIRVAIEYLRKQSSPWGLDKMVEIFSAMETAALDRCMRDAPRSQTAPAMAHI